MTSTPNDALTLYTFAKAAEILLVNRRTVADWVANGRIPATRIGPRSPRILRSDLHELIVRNRRETTDDE